MANLPQYSSRDVQINWAGHTFQGLVPDGFLELSFNSDVTDEEMGADRSLGISILPDSSGTVTLTLQQASPSNEFMSGVLNFQRINSGKSVIANMTVVDPSGFYAIITNAHIKTRPTITRGSTATGSSMAWVLYAEDVIMQQASGVDDSVSELLQSASAPLNGLSAFL